MTPPDRPSRPRTRVLRSLAMGLGAGLVAVGVLWFVMAPGPASAPVAATQGAATIGGPFQLTDGAGHAVTDQTFRGKYMLVYFGYTFCPDVCPTTLAAVATAIDALGAKADRVQPIFITVDPGRDTAPVVKEYAAAFSPRIDGLTGTPDQIAAVAHEYRVYYAKHVTGPGPGDYSMDHSSVLYLMGPDGVFVSVIRADAPGADMAAELSKYLS